MDIGILVIQQEYFADFINPQGWTNDDWQTIDKDGVQYRVCRFLNKPMYNYLKTQVELYFSSEAAYNVWLTDSRHLVQYADGAVWSSQPYVSGQMPSQGTFLVDTLAHARMMLQALGVDCTLLPIQ